MESRAVAASSSSFERKPLIISGNSLWSGDHSTTFVPESPDSLLRNYLIFVRELRGQKREPSIALRTEDLSVLASHLGTTEDTVLGGLLDMMGATRAQRSTMLALLAAGALAVVLSGTVVNGLTSDGLSVPFDRLADAVRSAITTDSPAASACGDVAADAATADTPTDAVPATSVALPTATSAATSAAAPPPEIAVMVPVDTNTMSATLLAELTLRTPAPNVLMSAAAAGRSTPTEANDAPVTGSVAQEPVSIGIAPDGSLVASVAPPVPAATSSDEQVATAELPDGTTVGVAAPPVPPPPPDEQVATAELPDGTTVGVAAPPVPPPAPEG